MTASAGPFRMGRVLLLLWSLLLLAGTPALAVQPDEIMADPALEARARTISEGLRCLVCQNQSIDDSAAPLARDLRVLVRERLRAGDSDDAIRQYLVSRYGAFVLLKPPFAWSTLLLWLTPPLVLGAGVVAMVLRRRQNPSRAPSRLSPAEEARLAALTGDGPTVQN